ncbi:putative transcription factor hes-1 [Danaus plexippus plexippus]|uniref:Transcription factor hes-1 n=1 Tax=Danaus plexippus plexippus TaxID=278856 RepID=A0A212FAZ6_DANPL|nr:putative transcription factor hes-1 [Danaus plexippus plexippus]
MNGTDGTNLNNALFRRTSVDCEPSSGEHIGKMQCSEDDDSQSGFNSEPTQVLSKAELRKTNKPIMEKKRRARINNCLNELKDLLMDAMDKDCSEDDDSQSGFNSEPTQVLSKAELRKTNKPIMEKKRRARINNCLNELKDLLMDAMDKDPARHSKLEKADILELTVKHLQTLQRQQLAAAIAADPAVLHRFKAGFGDCAGEVRRYLSRLASVPTGLRYRLGNHLNTCLSGIERLHSTDYPPLIPDPLRLDDERPSAFHYVRSTKPTSPPLSPLSCDSACDSSTELETPPRPVQKYPFPTPPSHSASDQDSSPEQKPTVSSTTISPDTLKQDVLRNKTVMEPLSIVIDVENYRIGIDASPKRAVDYSIRHKLKRHSDAKGAMPKLIKLDGERREKQFLDRLQAPEVKTERSAFVRLPDKVIPERKLTIPEGIPAAREKSSEMKANVPRTVISHTAASLAQSSLQNIKTEDKDSPKSPKQGTSSEMWRPW